MAKLTSRADVLCQPDTAAQGNKWHGDVVAPDTCGRRHRKTRRERALDASSGKRSVRCWESSATRAVGGEAAEGNFVTAHVKRHTCQQYWSNPSGAANAKRAGQT